ncbi:UNVERIFIED_CONTAM: Retrovirus-related Pol polyprotein from transposon RE2 [Sesamum radiatum]|uniref:Retrovirus-related Pol polyprotein from transposon RE2 n=1 Tax=Sesamum radiatum TaxID=300843 RepID=A0AAW2W0V6_SESRA
MGLMAPLVYVDDILVTTPLLDDIRSVKDYLHSLFTIKDIGEARYFLGLEIARKSEGIYIAQTKYVMDIIQDTGLAGGKTTSTPFPLGLKLSKECGTLLPNPDSYRRLIGCLLYLGFTRLDISYSVQQLSQFLNRPCDAHWKALHVVRYLKGCPSKGLFLPSDSNLELHAFCDADWASCTDSRRSLTDFCIFLGNAFISWKTKKQTTVQLRQSIVAWQLQFVSFVGYHLFSQILVFLYICLLSCSATIKLRCTLWPIQCFMNLGLVSMSPSPTCGGAVENQTQEAIVAESQLQDEEGVFDSG